MSCASDWFTNTLFAVTLIHMLLILTEVPMFIYLCRLAKRGLQNDIPNGYPTSGDTIMVTTHLPLR